MRLAPAAMKRLLGLILPTVILQFLLGLPGLGGGVQPLPAAELQVDATGIRFDSEKKIYRYEDARLTYGEFSMDADIVEVNLTTNRVWAEGNVRMKDRGIAGSAERIDIDLETGVGTIHRATLYDITNGYYLRADLIERVAEGRYVASNCSLTSCPPNTLGWRLNLSEIDYRDDEFATGTNSVLTIGGVPAFYFPWIAWPTVRHRRSGFLAPSLSSDSASRPQFDLGWRLRAPYFWALDVDHDLTISPEYIQRRGLGKGLEYNYAFWEDQTGIARLFHIEESFARNSDNENRMGVVPEGRSFKPTRYSASWSHNQGFGDETRFIWNLDGNSDGQVRREYFRQVLYRPRRDYEGTLSSQTEMGNASVTASHSSDYIQESIFADSGEYADGMFRPSLLPDLNYNTGGRPFSSSALSLGIRGRVVQFDTEEGISGQVREVQPALAYPVGLGGSWELRPTVSRRFVQFESLAQTSAAMAEQELSQSNYFQDEIEVELRVSFAKLSPPGERGRPAVKHRVIPRLIYFEMADVAQPLSGSFNRAEFLQVQSGVELEPKAGVIQSRFSQKMVTLRLDNSWMTGNALAGAEVARLNLIQRYNLLMKEEPLLDGPTPPVETLETEPGQRALPAILESYLTWGNLTSNLQMRYHHQLQKVTETKIGLSGSAPRGSLGVTYHENEILYRTPDNKLFPAASRINFNGRIKTSEKSSAGFSGVVNVGDLAAPLNRRMESGEMYFTFLPGCYSIQVKYSESLAVALSDQDNDGINDTSEHYIEKSIVVIFNLGGLFTTRSTTIFGED